MSGYRVAPQARSDLRDLMGHIAAENYDAAQRLRARLLATLALLAEHPEIGHWRDDLVSRALSVKFWAVGNVLVMTVRLQCRSRS